MEQLWYRLSGIPDLTLNKYESLGSDGVEGVLDKHVAFLRQLNRKGIVSSVSYHLFYLYSVPDNKDDDRPGHRLQIWLMVRGENDALENVLALIKASPLSDFFVLEPFRGEPGFDEFSFRSCSVLSKAETLLSSSSIDSDSDYYLIRDWDVDGTGRLYNMCKIMEALNKTALYRVDLYPVERSSSLREALRKPMNRLRRAQEDYSGSGRRDYDGKDVLSSYEDVIKKFDSSPHFIANIMVMADSRENSVAILDAAGSESLEKGKYNITSFSARFYPMTFLEGEFDAVESSGMILKKGKKGLTLCCEDASAININYLPSLFTLEEIAPFFRFPALYDGETIQIAKETAPAVVERTAALHLGKDINGYDVYFPLSLLPKHAFISGAPGSGKTNTMHHITSSLWKEHRIPFLVLEPAKQEYRALLNDPGMKEMYLFSPNADMSFPLHINPFEMPEGTLVAEHIRRLCSVFEGAFPLEPPMPFLLDTAIEAVYRDCGWLADDVYDGIRENGGKSLPTMSMLYRRLEEEVGSTTYSDEVRGNLESALKVRIGSLLRREMGDVFDVPRSTFVPEKWLTVPAVIELEAMGTGPANFLTLMLCSLIRETLKVNPHYSGAVRHVIFIEEAHNLIGADSEEQRGLEADPKQAATAFIVRMLAEVRALKEGIVIADQLPSVMAQEILKNTGLKIGLRLTSSDDREMLGSTMAASPLQLEQMSTFSVGEALIFYEKLRRPFMIKVDEWMGEVEPPERREGYTTARSDAKLRTFLFNNPLFLDENGLSVRIVMDKYRLLISEKDDEINELGKIFGNLTEALEKIDVQYRELCEVALGHSELSDEKLNAKYDEFGNTLRKMKKWFESGDDVLSKPFDIATRFCEWMRNITRLTQGRWSKFNQTLVPREEIRRVLLLMQKKVILMSSFYNGVASKIKAMGDLKPSDLRYDILVSIRSSAFPASTKGILEILERTEEYISELT